MFQFLTKLERVAGIEPAYPAWKAGVLPLNYTRLQKSLPYYYELVEGGGFEPPKLARQIYSLIPLATREPLQHELPRVKILGTLTQERHFMGIASLVQSFHRDFL